MRTQRVSDVKLGLDDHGFLWTQSLAGEPCRMNDDVESCVQELLATTGNSRFHVLATSNNESLIHLLCQLRRRDGRPQHVRLGPASLKTPGSWLGQTIVNRPVSLGGWRDLTSVDEITYALASELSKTGQVSPDMLAAASRHPAWPALSFTPGFSAEYAVRLVAALKDPRWHVNLTRPDSINTLASYFGLSDRESGPRHINLVLKSQAGKNAKENEKVELARTVLYAWSSGQLPDPPQDMPPGRDFLWRVYAVGTDRCLRAFRAGRVLLTFVRDVWLDNLTPPREYEMRIKRIGRRQPENVKYMALKETDVHRRELFVPHLFFDDTVTIAAWEQHVKAWRKDSSVNV